MVRFPIFNLIGCVHASLARLLRRGSIEDMNYRWLATYGIKTFDVPRIILPDRPFLSLPVAELRKVSKRAGKIARKFNYEFRDQIDWGYIKLRTSALTPTQRQESNLHHPNHGCV